MDAASARKAEAREEIMETRARSCSAGCWSVKRPRPRCRGRGTRASHRRCAGVWHAPGRSAKGPFRNGAPAGCFTHHGTCVLCRCAGAQRRSRRPQPARTWTVVSAGPGPPWPTQRGGAGTAAGALPASRLLHAGHHSVPQARLCPPEGMLQSCSCASPGGMTVIPAMRGARASGVT